MKPTYILKIGGSVATFKDKPGFSVRRALLRKVGHEINVARKKGDFNLVLIHGAGGLGHALAKEYSLKEGMGKNKKKLYGALLSRSANQKLNGAITEILVAQGLSVVPVHTASVIIQENKRIAHFETAAVQEALAQDCIPLLYGDMVFDKTLGMSICSGDVIAPYLASVLRARKLFFASDINGVFTKDPYLYSDAELVETLSMADIKKDIAVSKSHNVDVTGGLLGKLEKMESVRGTTLESIEIFNGLDADNYKKIFLNKKFPHSKIILG